MLVGYHQVMKMLHFIKKTSIKEAKYLYKQNHYDCNFNI